MRTLVVVLALVAVACGGCAADRKAQYLAAYTAFREAVQASAVEGRTIPSLASEVGQATSAFAGALKAISFPDAAKADVEALIARAVILNQQCSLASTMTDPAAMPAALLGITEQARMVRVAGAVVGSDLGLASDLGMASDLNTTVGTSSVPIPRSDSCGASNGWTCESLIGDVVTDALRSAIGADFALMNSGGLRADLTCPVVDGSSDFCPSFTAPPYPITRGQVTAVLPFGNISVAAAIDGATLKAMLENGISQMPVPDFRYPQVSGLCFSYDIEAAAGARVTGARRQAGDGSCTGAAIDLTAASSYTLATNNYVVAGGDSYPVVIDMAMSGLLERDVADWLSTAGAISPALQGRITCVDPHPSSGNSCPALAR
jgi:hypothetical protein